MLADSIGISSAGKPAKPAKPYPEFPLYAHATKRWAKKIRGRTHFFGHWDNWKAAYDRYQYEMPYLLQGRTPPPQNTDALTVGDLVNLFLEKREAKVESGELARRTWTDYKRTGELLVKELGRYTAVESLTSGDFSALRRKLSKRLGLVSVSNEIGRIRVFLNHAYKNDLIDKPVKLGDDFEKPSRRALKIEKQSKAEKCFTIDELGTLYHAADAQMKAFILLAMNGGLGNGDIGRLQFRHIESNWIDYPRPKTAVERKFPLWPETIKAIESAKQSKHPELPYVFVTKYGGCWYKDSKDSPLSAEFRKLCDDCKLHQEGRGFYALRHTFRTVADGSLDQIAISHIMGHSDESMAAHYREWVEPERLQKVVDHVYQWIKPMFKKPVAKKAGAK